MNSFIENLGLFTGIAFILAVVFKGTIAGFITGLNGGDINDNQRSKILAGLIVLIFIASALVSLSKNSPAEEVQAHTTQPVSQEEAPKTVEAAVQWL